MSSSASVGGHDRLRLFCGFPLPDAALDVLADWQAEHVSAGRIVPRAHVHITLAFLGSRPAGELPGIVDALRTAAKDAARPVLRPLRYRETRSVGMLVLEDEGGCATRIAEQLH